MKQIVFDMDGVLFATEALSDRLWKEMMEERGTPEMTAALQQCRGRNRTDTRAFFASHYPDAGSVGQGRHAHYERGRIPLASIAGCWLERCPRHLHQPENYHASSRIIWIHALFFCNCHGR